jgi:hypothetical protein
VPDTLADVRVTFDRIGRHGGRSGSPAPAPIIRSGMNSDQLVDSIALYARQFLGSPTFEVVLDTDTGKGVIFAGMRTAGTFTVEPARSNPCAECPQRVEQGVTYCSTRCRNAADSHDTPAGDGDE